METNTKLWNEYGIEGKLRYKTDVTYLAYLLTDWVQERWFMNLGNLSKNVPKNTKAPIELINNYRQLHLTNNVT